MNTFPNDAKATFEHWYAEVMEGYHLIGLHNSSDLEKMLIWARAHESESKDMSRKSCQKTTSCATYTSF